MADSFVSKLALPQDPNKVTKQTTPKLTRGPVARPGGVLNYRGKKPGPAVIGKDAPAFYESLANKELADVSAANKQLTDQLRAQAQGTAPSLAKAQLSASNQRTLAQTLASSQALGGNPAMRRQLRQQADTMTLQQGQQGALGAMQEQRVAQDALAAQIAQQAAAERGLAQQGFQIARAPRDLAAEQELQRFQNELAKWQQKKQGEAAFYGGLMQGGAQAGAAALMASDENLKTDIKPSKKSTEEFLQTLAQMSEPDSQESFAELLKAQGDAYARLKALEGRK